MTKGTKIETRNPDARLFHQPFSLVKQKVTVQDKPLVLQEF